MNSDLFNYKQRVTSNHKPDPRKTPKQSFLEATMEYIRTKVNNLFRNIRNTFTPTDNTCISVTPCVAD